MNRNIIVIGALALSAIAAVILLTNLKLAVIVLVPLGLILFSLILFSRGILIFLTILCFFLVMVPFTAIAKAAFQLRWIFFALFCFHVFGDIFLGRTVRRIKLFDISAISFIFYAFLSTFYSPYPNLTLERATTILILYISVFWIIWKYAYHQGPEKVISLILKVMWIVIAAGYLLIFISPHSAFMFGRFAGIFGNPNGLGVISAITLPLSFWQYLETKKKSALFLFFMLLAGLFLCAARGSLNAAIIGLCYFIYAHSKKYRLLIIFISISFVFISIWVVEILVKQFFLTYIRVETIPTGGGRFEAWPVTLSLIADKPFFGYGFGVEDKIFKLKNIVFYIHSGLYVHNSYLGIMLQLGIAGFMLLFGPLFLLLFKEIFSRHDSKTPLLRYALRASLISGLVCAIFESWIYAVGNGQVFPFWIIVMLLVSYRYHGEERGRETAVEGT